MADSEEWMDAEAAARYLNFHVNTIYQMVRDGRLPALRFPVRIRREDLDTCLERCRIKPGELSHLNQYARGGAETPQRVTAKGHRTVGTGLACGPQADRYRPYASRRSAGRSTGVSCRIRATSKAEQGATELTSAEHAWAVTCMFANSPRSRRWPRSTSQGEAGRSRRRAQQRSNPLLIRRRPRIIRSWHR